ncbi:DUF2325 domain-containing protein [Diaphorobacter aerolatus]|uniref:DUF2325 domain-containing protein n=1 Tax=Diaphorobacter aerolatus TaxID=1288495 RepID=A0A7H0GQS3_9BURK|nr:DUF2325 domain-containing protein [Diaphorobacter aerolatus]
MRRCGALQGRCTEQAITQDHEIERLRAELMRSRARVIVRDSLLAWEREERQRLQRTLNSWAIYGGATAARAAPVGRAHSHVDADEDPDVDPALLEHSLHAADLVICQTGCVSQDSFWRVEDHCKRTGKACVLVEQPDALRIVRVHPSGKTEQLAATSWDEKEPS